MGNEKVKANYPHAKNDDGGDLEGWGRFERAVDAAVKSGPKHKSDKGKPPAELKPKSSSKE